MAKLSEGGEAMRIIMGREMEGRLEAKSTTWGSLPGLKAPPARAVGALTDCADVRRTLVGRGALRKGRVPAHWPSGFSTRLPSTSGRRRKSKHGCVSHIDSLHRPFQPRSGAKVNIRYGGCPIGLGRTNQPEFCLSPHQSRLFLVHYTHTINRGRMREGSKSRAHPHGENKYWHNLLITNCFNSLKILL